MNEIVLISCQKQEIEQMIAKGVAMALEQVKPQPNRYLSREETASKYGVSLPTIHNWINDGLIKSYKINSRTLFKEHELDEALTEKKVYKYKHK